MKLLKTPRLRLAQLQTLAESTLIICKNIPSLATVILAVTGVLEKFKEGMNKDQASAEEKQELDRLRDKLNSGFFGAIECENLFPHDNKNVRTVLSELTSVVDKYGFQINKLSYDEETAQIDNMLADIAKLDVTALGETGIPRWLPLIEQANSNYKLSAGDYISDSAEASSIDAAGNYATELKATLDGLFSMIYAQILLEPTDELKKVYTEIKTLIKSMN